MKKYLSLVIFSLIGLYTIAQTPQVLFYGYIEEGKFEDPNSSKKRKKEKAPEKLKGVKIYVYNEDSLYSTIEARESGFYALLLNAGANYRVTFEKENYFCKSFELDCTHAQYPSNEGAIKCLTDVSLFKKIDNDDLLSLCKVPFAKCAFTNGDMIWDMEYTERAREKFYELAQPYYMAVEK